MTDIIGATPFGAIPVGTKITGILEHEVDWLKGRSANSVELWKNTINLWLWKDVDKHGVDLINSLHNNKIDRLSSNNAGMNQTKTIGAGISMPSGLYMALDKVDPELFNNKKKFALFKKNFPQFKTY